VGSRENRRHPLTARSPTNSIPISPIRAAADVVLVVLQADRVLAALRIFYAAQLGSAWGGSGVVAGVPADSANLAAGAPETVLGDDRGGDGG
jgi:hypothetical protein